MPVPLLVDAEEDEDEELAVDEEVIAPPALAGDDALVVPEVPLDPPPGTGRVARGRAGRARRCGGSRGPASCFIVSAAGRHGEERDEDPCRSSHQRRVALVRTACPF